MGLEHILSPQHINMVMLPFIRVIGLLVSLPIISTKLIPLPVKIILAIIITIFAYPVISQHFSPQLDYGWVEMAVIGAGQFLIGMMIGFLIQILFHVFILAGQIIAMQMGLGFASMMDPTNGVSVPAVGQIYSLMVTLMYFAVDGHIFVFQVLAESFEMVPVTMQAYENMNLYRVFESVSWMFASSLKIVLPAVIALLLVNISLGVMTKAAPQLNVFSIGFPLTMILGMIILYLTLFYLVPHFWAMTETIHNHVVGVAHGR